MLKPNLHYLSEDRLTLSLALALIGHAIAIFGITFSAEISPDKTPRLEITLASFKSDEAPDKADFLAQANQQGSGTLAEKAELTTTSISDKRGLEIEPTTKTAKAKKTQALPNTKNIIATLNTTLYKTINSSAQSNESKTAKHQGDDKQDQISNKIASLEARLARQQQAYARRPKVYRITSVSTKAAEDAAYQLAWQQKVEYAGNQNYPSQARQQGIEGDVRLMVAILPDGSIRKVEILASSGSPLLDSAAIRSVHLASPFSPFPPKISRKADVLEIIRTWQFRRDGFSSRG